MKRSEDKPNSIMPGSGTKAVALQIMDLFGIDSEIYRLGITQLVDGWAAVNERHMLIQKWTRFLGHNEDIGSHKEPDISEAEWNLQEWIFSRQAYYIMALQAILAAYLCRISPESLTGIIPDHHLRTTGEGFKAFGLNNMGLGDYPEILDLAFEGSQNLWNTMTEAVGNIDWEAEKGDIFQPFYESIFAARQRHRLGEHYTPSWLVRHVLDTIGFHGKDKSTLMDPACGSGMFLVEAWGRLIECNPQNADNWSLVSGMDINPLAVLTAKINYLVSTGYAYHPGNGLREIPISVRDIIIDDEVEILVGVESTNDHLKYDFVVGNPPWINWESISAQYRVNTMEIWKEYGLFSHSGMDTILGQGKKDISTLVTLISADKYLKPGGLLAFLITQSVFKSGGASEGFRSFKLPDGTPLKVILVEDLSRTRPFPQASNRTAILYLKKGEYTAYPLPYHLWMNNPGVSETLTGMNSPKIEMIAEPVNNNDIKSPWMTCKDGSSRALRKIIGKSAYQGREGANTGGANGILWLEIIEPPHAGLVKVRNLASSSRVGVPEIEWLIEDGLVYPLLKNMDVRRWEAIPSAHILMTQDPRTRRGISHAVMARNYPRTLEYLNFFKSQLIGRAAYKRYFNESDAFFSMFNVGEYTFSDIKVVWNRFGERMRAAVVKGPARPIIPQETLTMVACRSLDEAWYLAGILNSLPVEYGLASFSMVGGKSYAGPNLLNYINIPMFIGSTKQNILSLVASKVAAGEIPDSDLDRSVANFFEISPAELETIIQGWQELKLKTI